MNFQAAVAREGSILDIETCQLGEPHEAEVRVKIEACGICHTDLLALKQQLGTPLPAVLGHEGVGVIEALGPDVDDFSVGDRVLISFGACGQCKACNEESSAYCHQALALNFRGQRLDGSSPSKAGSEPLSGHFFAQSSFATHAIARTTNMVKVPRDIAAEYLAPMACGVQTGMSSVLTVLGASAGSRIAIMGCGTVGLSAVMAAKIAGCDQIVAVDIEPDRVELALSLGATVGVTGAGKDVERAVRSVGGIHCALDSTGRSDVIAHIFKQLLPQGKLVCAGVSAPNDELRLNPRDLVFSGRSIIGTVEGNAQPREFIPKMIEWYRQGLLPLEAIVKTYDFYDIGQAMDDLASSRVIKPVLLMPA